MLSVKRESLDSAITMLSLAMQSRYDSAGQKLADCHVDRELAEALVLGAMMALGVPGGFVKPDDVKFITIPRTEESDAA